MLLNWNQQNLSSSFRFMLTNDATKRWDQMPQREHPTYVQDHGSQSPQLHSFPRTSAYFQKRRRVVEMSRT